MVERGDRPFGSLASPFEGDGGAVVSDREMIAALGVSRLRLSGWFLTGTASTLGAGASTMWSGRVAQFGHPDSFVSPSQSQRKQVFNVMA